MQRKLVVMVVVMMAVFWLTACGREVDVPGAAPTSVSTVATAAATETPATDEAVVETPAAEVVAETESDACPEYFRFCTAVQISGAVTAETRAGVGGSFGSCAEWAAGGAERILELPIVLAAGDPPITVALTRLGSYKDAGQYELAATVSSGNPDAFPSLDVGGRTFSNGEGSAATVTVAEDGSGTVTATGLVELASPQVASPDPNARVDFAMQWTCQGTGN